MNSEFWDDRFKREHLAYGREPNDYVKAELTRLMPGTRLLELGCGEGRNSVYAASLGHKVLAVDFSTIGIQKTSSLSEEIGVEVEVLVSDVIEMTETKTYDAIMTTFLHFPSNTRKLLYEKMERLLNSNGLLIAEWFHPDQRLKGYSSGGPPSAEMMPTLEELRAAFSANWDILHLEHLERDLKEGSDHVGRASVLQMTARKR